MKNNDADIQWNAKVPQAKIWQLYENDARGLADDQLVDEVGFALYARCQSILLVHAHEVRCAHCDQTFATGWQWHKRFDTMVIRCPHCQAWEITGKQYRESIQVENLAASNALPAFQTFVERYPRTIASRERMLLIDRLIHEFHYAISRMPDGSLRRNPQPHASSASNLIEGSHDQVVAFLDNLTYGDASTSNFQATQVEWRTKVEEMKRRRSPKQ